MKRAKQIIWLAIAFVFVSWHNIPPRGAYYARQVIASTEIIDTLGTYVSLTGSDAATGTFSDPFLTIQYAVDNRISDTIWVRGGKYHEHVNIGVSGSIGDSIYLMAYRNENVYITGEKKLSSFAHNVKYDNRR